MKICKLFLTKNNSGLRIRIVTGLPDCEEWRASLELRRLRRASGAARYVPRLKFVTTVATGAAVTLANGVNKL